MTLTTLAGCVSSNVAVPPTALLPPLPPAPIVSKTIDATVVQTPSPRAITFPDFIYPPDASNRTWFVECSTDLVHWQLFSDQSYAGWPPTNSVPISMTNPVEFFRMYSP